MVRRLKRKYRRFCRTHKQECEFIGDLLGALGLFAFLFELYFLGIILGG